MIWESGGILEDAGWITQTFFSSNQVRNLFAFTVKMEIINI